MPLVGSGRYHIPLWGILFWKCRFGWDSWVQNGWTHDLCFHHFQTASIFNKQEGRERGKLVFIWLLLFCCCFFIFIFSVSFSFFLFPLWYNRKGWLGVKHQVTYLLLFSPPFQSIKSVMFLRFSFLLEEMSPVSHRVTYSGYVGRTAIIFFWLFLQTWQKCTERKEARQPVVIMWLWWQNNSNFPPTY